MELKDVRLFKNTRIDISKVQTKDFPSNYTVEVEDETSTYIGIVLEGQIDIKSYSLAGKNFTINTLFPGMIFGDVLMFGTESRQYPGNLTTKGKTKIAVLPNELVKKYLNNDKDFMLNFLSVLSDKVYTINSKAKMLSQDSVRDKILFYLTQQVKLQRSNKIQLNMTKEELANQLYMQRPSLSRELIKMRDEGIIDFNRWTITLKNKGE